MEKSTLTQEPRLNPIKLAVLPGDGIGPEVMDAALTVLKAVSSTYDIKFEFNTGSVGGHAIDAHGQALPPETVRLCEESDAILFGSVGGPKWESLPPTEQPERASLLPLRKHFDLYANFRPAVVYPELIDASPLKNDRLAGGLNILIVRELTSGIYFGQPKGREGTGAEERGFDTMTYTRREIERIAHLAFKAAGKRQKRLVSIDKANVLTTMVLWREVLTEVAKQYPDIALSHLYVDNAAMQLIQNPQSFDVIVASNMFGDILSDEAAMITGSIGMLPSASLSESGFGLYEPIGGSAPDIAGKNVANPIAQILSAAMLLEHSFSLIEPARAIEKAIHHALAENYRTTDILEKSQNSTAKVLSTSEMGLCIAEKIKKS